jgi:hypothetical protein
LKAATIEPTPAASADFFKESQPKGFANVQDVLGAGQ